MHYNHGLLKFMMALSIMMGAGVMYPQLKSPLFDRCVKGAVLVSSGAGLVLSGHCTIEAIKLMPSFYKDAFEARKAWRNMPDIKTYKNLSATAVGRLMHNHMLSYEQALYTLYRTRAGLALTVTASGLLGACLTGVCAVNIGDMYQKEVAHRKQP